MALKAVCVAALASCVTCSTFSLGQPSESCSPENSACYSAHGASILQARVTENREGTSTTAMEYLIDSGSAITQDVGAKNSEVEFNVNGANFTFKNTKGYKNRTNNDVFLGETANGQSGEHRNATLFAADQSTRKNVNQGTGAKRIKIATTTQRIHRDVVPKDVNDPEQFEACDDVYKNFLKGKGDLSLISGVWKSVCSRIDTRNKHHKIKDGCLYLPTDDHMKLIRDCVEHPNPWQYNYVLEDLFFERGAQDSCPSVAGAGASAALGGDTFSACDGQEGFQGSDGCVAATFVGDFPSLGLRIYKLDGLMGIDLAWATMIRQCPERFVLDENGNRIEDNGRKPAPRNASNRRVTVPLKVIICKANENSTVALTDEQISLSLVAVNRGFAGRDKCTTQDSGADGGEAGTEFEAYDTQRVDMGIQFTLDSTERVVNPLCDGIFADFYALERAFPHEDGKITILFTYMASLLGFAEFPCNTPNIPVVVDWSAVPQGSMQRYTEGHTLTHELGHHLGLKHTFSGGCSPGDGVDDTNAEATYSDGCPATQGGLRQSCGSSDPVHNFMDYSDDRCMCSFTQGQKDKMWQELERCEPTIYGMSSGDGPTLPTPCEDTPDWTSGGHGCDVYRNNGWCREGTFFGVASVHNYPDENCCGCGKGQTAEAKAAWGSSVLQISSE